MSRKIINYIISILFLFIITSCKEEENYLWISSGGVKPVEFDFSIASLGNTRALEGSKTNFTDGDVIHIIGHFTLKSNTVEDFYGCMRMVNGKFQAVEGSTLVWPDQAIEGSFEAYYINGSTGILSPDGQTETTLLSSLTLQTDPLYAESTESVPWGHAVKLNFIHALTYLQLVNLDAGIADRFHLSKPGLNNVFFLQRNGENLSLSFDQIPDQNDEDLVYISRNVSNVNSGGELTAQVAYFLKPGDYSQFLLSTQNDEPYLSFNNKVTENLEANVPYILDVKKSQGVTIIEQEEEVWDDSDENFDVNVPEFLEAVVNGNDYFNEEGYQILQATPTGSKLLHNVDFQFYPNYESLGFDPSIPSGIIFDGQQHYILNVGFPIFRYNNGSILNLGIKTIRATVISEEHNELTEPGSKDNSRQGGLCCFNQSAGLIQNIRVENVELTVNINSRDSQESHNAGCLVGSNAGTILDVSIYGAYSLTVQNYSPTIPVSASLYLGGIVGQNVGTLSGIKELGGDKLLTSLRVLNKCTGENGAFYLGGSTGLNSQVIDEVVLPNVRIDSRESLGAVCYVGGLVGRLDSQATSRIPVLQSSTVSGEIYGGNCNSINDTSSSYVGGIAGGVYNVSIIDCRSVCSVTGFTTNLTPGVKYFTGGAFGRIFTTNQEISNITAWGSSLAGASNTSAYLGNFAGAIPVGQSFVSDYEPNNMLVKELVNNMVGGNY